MIVNHNTTHSFVMCVLFNKISNGIHYRTSSSVDRRESSKEINLESFAFWWIYWDVREREGHTELMT